MNDLLEMPEVRARLERVPVVEYHRRMEAGTLEKRVELIRGLIIRKMPKSPLHSYVATKLFKLVEAAAGRQLYCRLEQPLTFADSEPEPDVSVVRGRAEDFVSEHPQTAALIIEVAVSSADLDRENAALYAENQVEEYWIVLPKQQKVCVEVFRQPRDGAYRKAFTILDGVLQCASVSEIRLDIDEFFKGVPR